MTFFEPSDLGGVLGGAGLNGKGEAVDKLPKLLGRDVGVCVEGGEHRLRGQWCGVSNRGSGGRGGGARRRGRRQVTR